MATPVLMPRQGQSVESCILVDWMVREGDRVAAEQPLAQIETDKATFEVPAPVAGVVLRLLCGAGDDVPVLRTIAVLGESGEDISGLLPKDETPAGAAPVAPSVPEKDAVSASAFPGTSAPVADVTGVSPRAHMLAAREGVDPASVPGTGPGGRVIERDVRAVLAKGPRLTPAAREAAAGGALPSVGSGLAGQVRLSDVQTLQAAGPGPAAETPVRGIRKLIADRMRQSLATTAQLTLQRRFDASGLLARREWIKANATALDLPNITINDLIVATLARVLKRHPELNAHFLGTRIARFESVHLGIAVDTPRGLMVPVVRDAHTLSLATLSRTIRGLSEACQKGNVPPDALTGGTFTLTTLGALGIEMFTPVLNAPEVGILGVGGLVQTAVPAQTPAGFRFIPMMSLSLTIDHQAVDGAPGARFLQELATRLERIQPEGAEFDDHE